MSNALLVYYRACAAIAQAKSIDEARAILDKAEAVRAYARQARNRALEMDAAEIRMRAERRLGELLAAEKREGRLGPGRREINGRDERPFPGGLAGLGVDKTLSSRAQALAAIPEAEFAGELGRWRDDVARAGGRVTTNLLRDRERAQARAAHAERSRSGCVVDDLVALGQGEPFGVILADPPWAFETFSARGQGRAPPYPTMSLGEIAKLPVRELAAGDCVLFLWAIGPMLREALDLIDAWGFEYKALGFTWMKQSGDGLFMGGGYWTRANAELCLLATRGSPLRLDAGVSSALLTPLEAHSKKPDEAQTRIERLVAGPYLELFARRPRAGWTVWGNEIARDLTAEAAE